MATGTIPSGEDVTFQSETQISLQAGFSAAAGSAFNAEIVDNVSNATPIEARHAPDSEGRAGVSEFAPLEVNQQSVATSFATPEVAVRPNPARGATQWQLELPFGETVSLHLFDAQGRLVKTLLDREALPAGKHVQDIALYDLPAGLYFLQTLTSQAKIVRRVVVLD